MRLEDTIAQITYPMTDSDGEITMGMHAPVIEQDTMLLQVTFRGDYTNPSSDGVPFNRLHGQGGYTKVVPVVNDRINMKAYYVPAFDTTRDTPNAGWLPSTIGERTWAAEMGDIDISHGEDYTMWAYVPAPEDDIDTVDISVIPGIQEFKDVPLEGAGS